MLLKMNMINEYTELMILLGIVIILILLGIILPILINIRKKQKLTLDSIDLAIVSIEELLKQVVETDTSVSKNFIDISTKQMAIDSKVVSAKDVLDNIFKAIDVNHHKTMNVLGGHKKPNKPRRANLNAGEAMSKELNPNRSPSRK